MNLTAGLSTHIKLTVITHSINFTLKPFQTMTVTCFKAESFMKDAETAVNFRYAHWLKLNFHTSFIQQTRHCTCAYNKHYVFKQKRRFYYEFYVKLVAECLPLKWSLLAQNSEFYLRRSRLSFNFTQMTLINYKYTFFNFTMT